MANSLSLTASSATSGATAPLGAIIGDNPIPYANAILLNGDTLTTGDLQVGDAGEFSGCTEFAIEFWFQTTSLPGSDGTIIGAPVTNSGALREITITFNAAGTFTFSVLDDGATVRTVTSGTALTAGPWYHVACTAQGGSMTIYLNGVSDGTTAAWSTHAVRTIGTTAGSEDFFVRGPAVAGPNYWYDEIAVYRIGLTAARALEHYNAGVNRGWNAQKSGARIGAVLDAVGSTAPRAIQAGARSVIPRYMSGQAPIEEIRRAVEADDVDAGFFAADDGTLTFLADGHRSSSPYNTVQVLYGDGGGSERPYLDCAMDHSETNLINEWNVTRSAYQNEVVATQTASDATSISRYFKRSQSLSDVPTLLNSDASTIATELLAKYKDPMQRFTSISPKMADADTCLETFRLDLMQRVEIKRRPPGGGSAIDQQVFVQQIHWSGSPGVPPSCTLTVSPL